MWTSPDWETVPSRASDRLVMRPAPTRAQLVRLEGGHVRDRNPGRDVCSGIAAFQRGILYDVSYEFPVWTGQVSRYHRDGPPIAVILRPFGPLSIV